VSGQPGKTDSTVSAELSRDLTLFHVMMMGLGMMIGAGVFVGIGLTIPKAGPGGLLLTFALNGVIAVFTAMSFAELSSAIPRAGGLNGLFALEIAKILTDPQDGQVTAVTVDTGRRRKKFDIDAFVETNIQAGKLEGPIRTKTIDAHDIVAGILAEAADYDLVVMGCTREPMVSQLVHTPIPETIAQKCDKPLVMVKAPDVSAPGSNAGYETAWQLATGNWRTANGKRQEKHQRSAPPFSGRRSVDAHHEEVVTRRH
jgi:nucleotide-binding universal stress UspA family protein